MPTPIEVAGDDYVDVAASQTAQVLGQAGGVTGQKGDMLSHIIIFPANTSPGAVSLLDGSSSKTIFPGGANSVGDTTPFHVVIGHNSRNGPFKITTGADVSVRAVGRFS